MRNNYADLDAQPTLRTDSDASGSASVITIDALPDQFWVIDWISWSYSDDPISGGLTVSIGGVVVWQIDITVGGPGHIEFDHSLYTGTKNQPVVVTLADGSVASKLNLRYR